MGKEEDLFFRKEETEHRAGDRGPELDKKQVTGEVKFGWKVGGDQAKMRDWENKVRQVLGWPLPRNQEERQLRGII